MNKLSIKTGKLLYSIINDVQKENSLDLSKLKPGNFYMVTISSTDTSGTGVLMPLNSKMFRATVNYSFGSASPLVISAEIDRNLLIIIGELKNINGILITELIIL